MRSSGGLKIRLLIGAAIVVFALFKYYANRTTNPYTEY